MNEYEQLGHMSRDEATNAASSYFLPHHAVIKETSTTTKVRVVFDGSAKTTNGKSLNDILLVGPTIQDDLISIIIRFRTHRFALTADIEKMYRQINVKVADQQLQKILWRSEPQEPIQIFSLKTVTYGTSSAPFLAVRTLNQLAIDEGINEYQEASNIIQSDFYVDDLITGASTIETAIQLQKSITNILAKGKMNIRKWNSNSQEILNAVEQQDIQDVFSIDKRNVQKTLGLYWNSSTDEFSYSVKSKEIVTVTKRTILSAIAQIYDPLGLIGPILILAKLVMQKLWQVNLNWDESVPLSIHTLWSEVYNNLDQLNQLKIPRYINPDNINNPCDLHGFSDASEKAYGACVYVRYYHQGHGTVALLCSKARVAPLKTVNLPRLELCGALLLTELMSKVLQIIRIKIANVYCWTDSTIVLSWIVKEPCHLKTYVANRISEIQGLLPNAIWKHVPTTSNPADIISRGMTPGELINCSIWWSGPQWLLEPETEWPRTSIMTKEDQETIDLETKTISLVTALTDEPEFLTRYSSFSKLQRIMAFCLRFIERIKSKKKPTNKHLTEIKELRGKGLVSTKSKLHALNPFLDTNGLIRVGGRLGQSWLSTDQKHPVVLPEKHHVTTLIMREVHIVRLHCGAQALLSYVRLKYWPISGKNLAKKLVRTCITCFKCKPHSTEHMMGHLPSARTSIPIKHFHKCGVDYCGPFQILQHRGRGRIKSTKGYIAIFICFASKAVHLELVTDLTAEAFLAVLRRFTSRRGLPSDIYSDNGTNFVRANGELQELFTILSENHDHITVELAKQQIKWHFIPPRSPHFGGLWEAAVKSTKYHFNRVAKNINLTYEEFNTLIIQIEAVLNSRPLTPLSEDPNDLNVLTPAHFLIGDSLLAPMEPIDEDTSSRLSVKWQHIQRLKQHFWQRWSREYLHQLQQRTKWSREHSNVKIGSLVLLIEDSTPPQRWPVGRIIELFPGDDNIVRCVSVKTATGVYKRAVRKVAVLPIHI